VMLNGCVSRKVMLRTGSSAVPTVTVDAPSLTAGTGSVGSSSPSRPWSAALTSWVSTSRPRIARR
jgi:hypothetical protein